MYMQLQTHKGEIVRSIFLVLKTRRRNATSYIDLKRLYFRLQSHLTESSAEHAQIQNS